MILTVRTVNKILRSAATVEPEVSFILLKQRMDFLKLLLKVVLLIDSKDWHQGGRDNPLLCTTCRTYENKHGCLPPAPKSGGSSFMFKPVKAEEEVNSKHGMRTRQSKAPVSPRLIFSLVLTDLYKVSKICLYWRNNFLNLSFYLV